MEINKNVDEDSSAERITQYLGSVGIASGIGVDRTPWSGAFLSWLINASGNKDHLVLSGANITIWNSAVAKRLTFLPGEKSILPGDIAIFSRANPSVTNLDDLRAGKGSFTPSQSGIVYSSDADQFTTIEPNVGYAIRLRDHTISASKNIIGFIRLSDQ